MTIGGNSPYDLAYIHRGEVAESFLNHEAPRKDAKYPISIIYNSYHDVPYTGFSLQDSPQAGSVAPVQRDLILGNRYPVRSCRALYLSPNRPTGDRSSNQGVSLCAGRRESY
jgi:hypothetical protein